MSVPGTLADHLRARREILQPHDVGLPVDDGRRVPGLRREEVAQLAGISAEYYVRLEQGRDRHPSVQVVDSIAAALQLDAAETEYLHGLARVPSRGPHRSRGQTVSPALSHLIDSWNLVAAYVQGRGRVNLAANRLAVALSPTFAPGAVPLRSVFVDPEARTFYRDWEAFTQSVVPALRAEIGTDVDDRLLVNLIGELSITSERFRTLWARHEVKPRPCGTVRLLHPQVGELELTFERLVRQENDQSIVTYFAEPGTESHERMRLLASLAENSPAAATVSAKARP